jgi:hypothetical membrane protein
VTWWGRGRRRVSRGSGSEGRTPEVARYRDRVTACLAGLGMLSPGFLALVTAAGLLRPGYNMLRDEVSALGLGVTAAMADGGFVGFGALLCLFAVGLGRSFRSDRAARRGSLLLALVGLGVAFLAVFPTDPDYRHPSLHGIVHGSLFLGVVAAFVCACLQFGRAFRRDPLWRRLALYTWANSTAIVVIWLVWEGFASHQEFDPNPPLASWSGLIQRVLILGMSAWIGVVAVHHTRLALTARRVGRAIG